MTYMKYTQYAYLIAALFLFFDAYSKMGSGTDTPYLSLFLGIGAIALFFFRRKFAKKYDSKNNNQ